MKPRAWRHETHRTADATTEPVATGSGWYRNRGRSSGTFPSLPIALGPAPGHMTPADGPPRRAWYGVQDRWPHRSTILSPASRPAPAGFPWARLAIYGFARWGASRVPAFARRRRPRHFAMGLRPGHGHRARSGQRRPAPGGAPEDLADEERARRERSRELAAGIVAYACDESVSHAAFSLGGKLWWVSPGRRGDDARRGDRSSPGAGRASRARRGGRPPPQPDGPPRGLPVRSAPLRRGHERPAEVTVYWPRRPAPATGEVTWGAAEFIAAEEMGRSRGFWWSPDGGSLLAARVDNSPVGTWWTSDPSTPATPPQPHRYPAAGTADALVSLWHLPVVPGVASGPGCTGTTSATRTWYRCTGAAAARPCCWWNRGTTRPAPSWPPTSSRAPRRSWPR